MRERFKCSIGLCESERDTSARESEASDGPIRLPRALHIQITEFISSLPKFCLGFLQLRQKKNLPSSSRRFAPVFPLSPISRESVRIESLLEVRPRQGVLQRTNLENQAFFYAEGVTGPTKHLRHPREACDPFPFTPQAPTVSSSPHLSTPRQQFPPALYRTYIYFFLFVDTSIELSKLFSLPDVGCQDS